MNENDLKKANIDRLKTLCLRTGIDHSDDRADMIKRLMEIENAEHQSDTNAGKGDETQKDETEKQESNQESTDDEEEPLRRHRRVPGFVYKDIESTIRTFSGDDHVLVKRWLQNFEETAEMMRWSNIQKLVYAKRSLTGTASHVIQVEGSRSWAALKATLLEEFDQSLNSAEIHILMSTTTRKADESYISYIIRMRELASQGNVDVAAQIQYIINGIQDNSEDKLLLYGARTFQELKERFKTYEAVKKAKLPSTTKATEKKSAVANDSSSTVKRSITQCDYCKRKGHTEIECRQKKLVCYKCNQQGHKSTRCTVQSKNTDTKEVKTLSTISAGRTMHKTVRINSIETDALIDTGSDVTIVREDFYRKLKPSPQLSPSDIKLTGIGNATVVPIGAISITISIDNTEFVVNAHIVQSNVSSSPVLLGKDFLQTTNLIIEQGRVTVEKPESENNIFAIAADVLDDNLPNEIQDMVNNYEPNQNFHTDIETTIVLKDDERVYHNPRRLAQSEKQIVEQQISDWLKEGIIAPSTSEYASPILLTKKKDGTMRLCVDYRRLNQKIVKDRFPFPNMEVQLDELQSATFFSTLDLQNGFFHVPVEQNSRKYTAFCCHKGIYQFNKTYVIALSALTRNSILICQIQNQYGCQSGLVWLSSFIM